MSGCGGDPSKCKMCSKPGLLIMLTRYAVATRDTTKWYTGGKEDKKIAATMQASEAPEISGSFVKPTINLGDTAYYTQRLLRGGYVYVFDEARNTWEGYAVTDEGYLISFNIYETFGGKALKGKESEKRVPCKPLLVGVQAGCIAVTEPHAATNIWITFSDTQWTEATFENFKKDKGGIRKKQMRKFNVQKHLNNQGMQEHSCAFEGNAEKYIAEYNDKVNPAAFAFSPIEFSKRCGYYDFTKYAEGYDRKGPFWDKNTLGTPGVAGYNPVISEKLIKPYEQEIRNGPLKMKGVFDNISNLCIRDLWNMAAWPNTGKRTTGATMPPPEIHTMLSECYTPATKLGLTSLVSVYKGQIAILALDDLPGIAMDLAGLMSMRAAEFSEQPKYKRKLFASTSILNYKNAVHSKAELAALAKKRNDFIDDIVFKRTGTKLFPEDTLSGEFEEAFTTKDYRANVYKSLSEKERADFAAIEVTEEELEKSRNEAWKIYSLKEPKNQTASAKDRNALLYDEETRAKFQKDFEDDLATFDPPNILALAKAHVSWMGSVQMANYFQSHFDTTDPESGKVYKALFTLCIAGTQDKGPCAKLYADWLEAGDTSKPENLLMRAAVFNQDELAAEIMQAVAEARNLAKSPTPSGKSEKTNDAATSPLKELFDKVATKFAEYMLGEMIKRDSAKLKVYDSTWAHLKDEDPLLSHFYTETIGAGIEHMAKWAESRTFTPFMFCRAAFGEAYPVFIDVTTTAQDYIEYLLLENIETVNGSGAVRKKILAKQIDERQRIMKSQGIHSEKQIITRTFYAEIPANKMTEAQRKKLAALGVGDNSFRANSMQAYLALRAGEWDEAAEILQKDKAQRVRLAASNARKFVGRWGTRGLTGYSAVTDFIGVKTALDAINKQAKTTAQAREAWARFVTSISAMLGTAAEIMKRTISSAIFRLKFGSGMKVVWAKRLGTFARWAPVPGIILSIVMDVVGARDAYLKGQKGLMALHIISGVVGVISFFLLLFATTLVGLIVMLAAVALSALIDIWKDDPYRDWIGKCSFGNYDEDIKYKNTEEEIAAFQGI